MTNTSKKKMAKLLSAIALTLLVSAPVWAEGYAANLELVTRLEEMQNKHDWQVRTRTGKPRQLLVMHQANVNRIVNQLKSGQQVDPKEIDRLYKQHYQDVLG